MNIVLLGPPGVGKGSVSSWAAQELGLPHISTGEIFREAIQNESPLGRKVKIVVESGEFVPDELTIALVKERLARVDAASGYLLDGFPRNVYQAESLESFSPSDKAIFLSAPQEVLLRRLQGRRFCPQCGATYHVEFIPPLKEGLCDRCGAQLELRKDDSQEFVERRLKLYFEQTQIVVDFYQHIAKLVTVDASLTPERVRESFLNELNS